MYISSPHGSLKQHSWPAASCTPMQHVSTKDAEKLLPQFLPPGHPCFTCFEPLRQGEHPAADKGGEMS